MEEILRSIQSQLADLTSKVADLDRKFDALPDLHFLQAAAVRQIREATEARDYRRRTEMQLDEIYKSMATSPEIEKLRHEVAESLEHERNLDLRIATIEGHLGISNPLNSD